MNKTTKQQLLSLVNLSVGYSKDDALHSDINVSVNAGEFTCLLGPNGAGKSTLIKTISGFLPKVEGEVWFGKERIENLNEQKKAKLVSVVLTERISVPNLTVFELVGLGRTPYTGFFGKLTDTDVQKVYDAIKAVGLAKFAHKSIDKMSDGERQKAMIAKALVQETPFIILDEPTAFLDFPAKIEIMQLLLQLSRDHNRGILLSTHDLEMALQIADKIWLIGPDRKLTEGVPEDLVLSNDFNDFFERDGIHFDKHAGNFKFHKSVQKPIQIVGEGIERCWLEKALNRIGYIDSNESNDLKVELRKDDNAEIEYQLTKTGLSQNHQSIQSLIEQL
ncbi:ABC transporter ATP-binding protein [Saccharicrinis aurantiacus]|uniref:ABC transporter ATP-binding protein n=1 Tax=Saccharicrinis aurantiacus TaxID=1849719 RepID=UPI00094FC133|nr:ABC transporter ATP-binding protein [Saccharicrinis aurantiacus]